MKKGFMLFAGFLVLTLVRVHATRVIANWDLIPNQIINEPFKAGVVAFHESGVDVEFTVNGETRTVTEPAYNDRTDVWEYFIILDPVDFVDGPLTISAVAKPDGAGHESKDVGSRTLICNASGTYDVDDVKWVDPVDGNDSSGDGSESNPYKTIPEAMENITSGGTVYLKAGTYTTMFQSGPRGHDRWTTVTPAPGLTRDQVIIDSEDDVTHNYIKWVNVTLTTTTRSGGNSYILGYLLDNNTWFDGVEAYHGNGPGGGGGIIKGQSTRTLSSYWTNGYIHDVTNAGPGFSRNNVIEKVGADIWRAGSNLLAINTEIRSMTPVDGAHPDLIQFYNPSGPVDNIIIYNMEARHMNAQGIFGSTPNYGTNIAFVNWLMHKSDATNYYSQFAGHEHMLLWHFTSVGNTMWNRDNPLVESSIKNCMIERFWNSSPESLFDYNHFGTDAFGTNVTTGKPFGFTDETGLDFTLTESSPGYHAGTPLECVPADIRGIPYHATTPNLGAYSSETASVINDWISSVPVTHAGASGFLVDQQGRRVDEKTAGPGVYFRYDGLNITKVIVAGP